METYLKESRLLHWPTTIALSRIIARCCVPGEPISKQRPRLARNKNGRAYTPKQTVEAEMDVQICVRAASPNLLPDNVSQYGVRCLFVASSRQRRDIDNMLKLVLDACTGLIWEDDTQVTEIIAQKQLDKNQPRTEIVVYKTTAPEAWSRKCEVCIREFRVYPSWQARRFCSRRCSAIAHTTRITVGCLECGVELELPPSRVKEKRNNFCSTACKSAYGRIKLTCANCGNVFDEPRSTRKDNITACSVQSRIELDKQREYRQVRGTCPTCGGPKSKQKYSQCNVCKLANLGIQKRVRPENHIVHRV